MRNASEICKIHGDNTLSVAAHAAHLEAECELLRDSLIKAEYWLDMVKLGGLVSVCAAVFGAVMWLITKA